MSLAHQANILIVNDRPDQLAALEVALSELKENIVTAASGEEAVRVSQEQSFAVILLDVRMPGMDGFQTADLMRRRGDPTPIIFVTALEPTDGDLARCYSLGAVDYIRTPVVSTILRTKVKVFVQLFEKSRQVEMQSKELTDRLAELTQVNRELEAFSYSLSHDFRGPLRAVHHFTQLVLDDFGQSLEPRAKDMLQRAVSASTRLERLMQGLLAVATISFKEMRSSAIDVERLLVEIINERPEWQLPQAEIRIEGPLSPMRGDEVSLTQCLCNLIANAVKFVAPGVVPRVRIYSEAMGDRARLHIEDNGIGIPAAAHIKVFEKFQRMPQAAAYEGDGVGLAIVQKAIERMGGKVDFHSEPGCGTCFWIELPTVA